VIKRGEVPMSVLVTWVGEETGAVRVGGGGDRPEHSRFREPATTGE
jgi:hypothetical protein